MIKKQDIKLKVPVYFVKNNSHYKKLNADCYDIDRDALTTKRTDIGIYHPPCRLFSKLKYFSKADYSEKNLAYWSIDRIQEYGGILEHPNGTSLFKEKNIKLTASNCIKVNLSWFGFQCEKSTLIFYNKIQLEDFPQLPLNFNAIESKVSKLSQSKRDVTPLNMCEWLLEAVQNCNNRLYL